MNIKQYLDKRYGLNTTRTIHLCKIVGLNTHILISELEKYQLQRLNIIADKNYVTDKLLRKEKSQTMLTILNNNTYRARRLKQKLPVRGQRTRSNAKNANKSFK
jgi:small subunit ribosomal protein S13